MGSFGKVYLVHPIGRPEILLAMKVISKRKLGDHGNPTYMFKQIESTTLL